MNNIDISKAGKLLVQNKLLKGKIKFVYKNSYIEIHVPQRKKTYKVQVRTTEESKSAGGKWKNQISWNLGKISGDYIACVNLSEDEAWLFTRNELLNFTEHPSKDKFYIYTDTSVQTKKKALKYQFEKYLIENVIKDFKSGMVT